jgi:PAS domain S-box-containing protein
MAEKYIYEELEIRAQELENFLVGRSGRYQTSANTLPGLPDIVDMKAIQSLMNHFYALTNIGVAILDLKGNILVSTGWQDICERFHRVHPETCKNCLESDLILSSGIEPGTFKLYRCKNHMWDMATPIIAGRVKVGNLFLGQFFFEDELPDIKTFSEQARKYGFDENKYLSALEKVPRWSCATVNEVMGFYTKLANLISDLSYKNLLLNKSEEMLSRSQELAHIGSWKLDLLENHLTWSDEVYRIFGCEPKEFTVTYEAFLDAVHPHDREKVNNAYFGSIREGHDEYEIQHRIVRRITGEIRTVHQRCVHERDETGAVVRSVGMAQDITDRKRAEENLRRLNEQLEHKVAERTKKLQTLVGELTLAEQKERQRLAKILHDHLQQLLVGARINSEILCRSFGEKHNKIAQNVFDLINQSIQTSRSLTAELYPPVLQQGLSAVLKWTVRWMSENHGLTIDLQIDPDIEPKQEDITAFLYQSTRELLLNVIKHSGVKSARLEMSCDEEQKQLRVTVSDRGAGFDTGAVLKNEGTGFGLFSIHERLQLMGGTILIESSPGNGASLSLIVPLEAKEEKKNEAIREIKTEHKTTEKGEDRIRVLVVDDHTVVRQGISALLGFHSDIEIVGEADDGQEAVEKARQLHPDVILMDINMPRMDGIQATRIIRSEHPYVRIIGLSMHDRHDQADQMIQAGAFAYCKKDGSSDELLSSIRRSD